MHNTFDIHFNGDVPFKVEIDEENHEIKVDRRTDTYDNGEYVYENIKSIKDYEYVFVFHDTLYGYHGNTLLIELADKKYMYIGKYIYVFTTREKIIDYQSPIVNSDVPYPFATSENYHYLMIEKVYFEKTLARDEDPYGVYYGHIKSVPKIQKKDVHQIEIEEIEYDEIKRGRNKKTKKQGNKETKK